MEERKNFMHYIYPIAMLKALPLHVEFFEDDDGSYSVINKEFETHAEGKNFEECRADLISVFRDISKFYFEDIKDWYTSKPELLIYALKVMCSTDKELIQCLVGEHLSDI